MRHTILGLAAIAAMSVTAAPAMACGYYGGCPVGYAGYGSYGYPSGFGYAGYGSYGYPTSYGHVGYGYGYGYAPFERLPVPSGRYVPAAYPQSAQYYYVDQGPTYTGPGNFAPYPTYQETAVRGWTGFERGYSYPYDGGPYASAINHYPDIAPAGPLIQTYRWHRGHSHQPRVQYFGIRGGMRTGHAARSSGYRVAGPGVMVAPRSSAARHQYQRPPRRAY